MEEEANEEKMSLSYVYRNYEDEDDEMFEGSFFPYEETWSYFKAIW